MGKSKVRVRRLTLPPSCDAARHLGNEGAADQFILQKEQFSRIPEISIMAGEVSRPRPHLHGVEPPWRSKFWAAGESDVSSVSSSKDDSVLVEEALEAGLSLEQIRQAEEELVSPSPDATKVSKQLKEGSMAKKVIDVWVNNQRNKGRPWCGPLPPPRQSPLRTLGDALANAKIEKRRCSSSSVSQMDRRYTPPCHKILLLVQGASQH
jgi:hypothetical protein